MARPNTMPTRKIGRKLMIGPVWSTVAESETGASIRLRAAGSRHSRPVA
jgi:hypothetical protein